MATCMPRLDNDYACVSDERYIHTYVYKTLITSINPTNYVVRRDLVPQIFTTPSV
jgi:hypothetical protein